jgi:hypothetical protein
MPKTAGVVNKPVGYAQYTTLTTAKKLTDAPDAGVAMPDWSIRALIQAEGADLRWRDDGIAPTPTVGMIIPMNTTYEYEGDLEKIQLIETAVAGTANVTFYKY